MKDEQKIIPRRVAVLLVLRPDGGLLFVKYFAEITRFVIISLRIVEPYEPCVDRISYALSFLGHGLGSLLP